MLRQERILIHFYPKIYNASGEAAPQPRVAAGEPETRVSPRKKDTCPDRSYQELLRARKPQETQNWALNACNFFSRVLVIASVLRSGRAYLTLITPVRSRSSPRDYKKNVSFVLRRGSTSQSPRSFLWDIPRGADTDRSCPLTNFRGGMRFHLC